MERLTDKIDNTNCVKGCGSNCKYGFQYCRKEDWENCQTISDVIDKLAEYEDLEEQGLLLRLPYPLGTEYIYFVDIKDRKVYKLDAEKIEVNMTPIRKKILYTVDGYEFLFEDFEKAIFLTREEAEVRLKELISRKEQQ